MIALDQSYSIDFPLAISVHAISASGASDSEFADADAPYTDCSRGDLSGQPTETDS